MSQLGNFDINYIFKQISHLKKLFVCFLYSASSFNYLYFSSYCDLLWSIMLEFSFDFGKIKTIKYYSFRVQSLVLIVYGKLI